MPADADHADCDSALIQISASNIIDRSTVNMNRAPSRVPSFMSMLRAMNIVRKSSTMSEVISRTLTFSIALAPREIAARVRTITMNWKKITWPGACKNSFHTCTVSTPSPVSPPVMPSWKYFRHHPATTA